MSSIDSIAADYVERAAVLDPYFATWARIGGHDDELPDLSADGFAGRADLDRSTLAALEAAETPGLREQVARAAMQERLAVAVERYDAGDTTSELNVIDSWVQYVRELFDLMPTDHEEGAVNVARRMAAVPEAYRQFSRTLLDAARNGRPPARLQVEEVAKQCASWSIPEGFFYSGLVEQLTGVPDSLRGELDAAGWSAVPRRPASRPAGDYAGTGTATTGVVVGLDVPPEGSMVIPILSPGPTPEASTGPAWPAGESKPAERAPAGPMTHSW